MNTVIKKNKPNIASKGKTKETFKTDDLKMLSDPYYLDPELTKELKEKDLIGRFVNLKRIQEQGGRHQKGWIPYKRESQRDDLFGKDPDGYVRRGADLVLAVKSTEQVALHKRLLRQEAATVQVQNLIKRNRDQLRREAIEAGVDDCIKVIENE